MSNAIIMKSGNKKILDCLECLTLTDETSGWSWFFIGVVAALMWFALNSRIGKLEDAIQKRETKTMDVGKQATDGASVESSQPE